MRVTEREIDEQVVSSRWTTAIAVVTIVLGMIAIAFPFFASVASTLVLGWIFIFAGIAQIVYAFQSRGAGQVAWKLILGCLYLFSPRVGKATRRRTCLHAGAGRYHFCARHHSSGDRISNASNFTELGLDAGEWYHRHYFWYFHLVELSV